MPTSKAFRPRHTASLNTEHATVTIEKLVYGGDGLARICSENPDDPRKAIVWVPDSIPGETMTIEAAPTSRSKKAPLKGRIQTIEAPSQHRIVPTCQHALPEAPKRCGGCQWQHMTPETQLEWKRSIVAESFERLGKLPNTLVKPTLGTSPWHYRNTITWEVVTLPNGDLQLGFHQRESNATVAINECSIAAPPLEALLKAINSQPALANQLLQGVQRVKVRAANEATVLLGLEPNADNGGPLFSQKESLAAFGTLRNEVPSLKALWQLTPTENAPVGAEPQLLWGESVVTTQLKGVEYSLSLPHFMQAQPQGTEALLTTLHQAIESVLPTEEKPTSTGKTIVWDGYCGMGLFGLSIMASPLGSKFSKVIGVEGDLTSVELATLNSAQLGFSHRSQWHAQAVEDYIADWYLEASLAENLAPNRITVGIIDPPRTGAKPVVLDWLAEHTDKAIVYISCNPSTLARDCRHLVDKGWQVAWVQPVDCFPQTYHIECVALLTPAV